MVLGAAWEGSDLSADSSAAAGCGEPLSVPGEQIGGKVCLTSSARTQALTGQHLTGIASFKSSPTHFTGEKTEAQGAMYIR